MRVRLYLFLAVIWLGALHGHTQDSLFQIAENQFVEANYDEAFEIYRTVSSQYQDSADYEMYGICNIQMTLCLNRSAQYQRALKLAQNTLWYVEEFLSENAFLKAEVYRALGEVTLNIGKSDEALDLLLQAEKLYPPEYKIEIAESDNLLGVIYWNNNNKDLGLQYHQKALDIRTTEIGPNSLEVGDSYNNIGLIYAEDNPTQAGIYFERALKIYENQLGTLHPKVAFCLINLARTRAQQSRIQEATDIIDRVMKIWDGIYQGDHPNKTFTTSTLGQIYAIAENYERALHFQQLALKEYIMQFGPKHPEVANTHFLIAELYLKKEEYKEALRAYQEAIYANLVDQEFSNVRSNPKLKDYLSADGLLSALLGKAKALEALHFGLTLQARDLKAALHTYNLADSLVSEIRKIRVTENDKIRLGEISRLIYENGIRLALVLADQPFHYKKYAEIAFSFCERSKSSVLLEAIQETKAKSFSGIPDSLIRYEDSLKNEIAFYQQQVAKGENIDFNQSRLFVYQQAQRNFASQLETDFPKYYELKYQAGSFDIQQIMSSLEPGEVMISYFQASDNLYVFAVTQEGIDIQTRDIDFFRQNVSALRNAIKFRISATLDYESTSLYQLLIPELSDEITSIIFIPDGILSTVPFEALKNPETTEYLVQNYNVSYDYSSQLMLQRRNTTAQLPERSIMLMAPVDFRNGTTRLNPLPSSEEEINDIRFLFGGQNWEVHPYLRDNATETFVKSGGLTQYRYLHLATHGQVNQSQPELSQIFLHPDENEDGSLYSGDIYNLRINAELVCLSACETGLGKLTKGEGIVGLSRALLYAGAQNLIVSLWQVADASTSELMIDFYKEYLLYDDVTDFNQALRRAKVKMIRSEAYSHPYYWAPFILVGR